MKKRLTLLVAVASCALCSAAHALYSVSDTGDWPKSWPSELEPLRKQARTFNGPLGDYNHFAIRFKNQEQFEAAWPHMLKVKTKGSPIFLMKDPNYFLGDKQKAGVVIHLPPAKTSKGLRIPRPSKEDEQDERTRWYNSCYIEVVADGKTVDFERVRAPEGIRVIDERSKNNTPADAPARAAQGR